MLALQQYFPDVSPLVFGCMGLGGDWNSPTTTTEQLNPLKRPPCPLNWYIHQLNGNKQSSCTNESIQSPRLALR